MKYRREIDGLRAVAVIPVVLFHAGLAAFAGGFVGVDVFFVISGYLITNILLADLRAGRFSLATFYERRARRILPALFFVIGISLVPAWILLLPGDLKSFGDSLIAVATFVSNVLFWRESDYFATAAELKPLLHTWSLAIEEQFYVVFPLLLAALHRWRPKWMVAVLVTAAAMSLALAEWASTHVATAAFFLLPTRAWELGVGAILAVLVIDRPLDTFARVWREALSVAGLVMIGVAIVAFDRRTPFPGLAALVPTVGTALVLAFATENTLVARLLGLRPMVAVGLISYSAYLWHQPMFAFLRHASSDEPTPELLIAVGALSFGLAAVSWRYVEAPFRDKARFDRRQIFQLAAAGTLGLVVIGGVLHATDGFINRYDERLHPLLSADHNPRYVFSVANKIQDQPFKDDGRTKVLIIGDSFSGDLVNALHEVGADAGLDLSLHRIHARCGNLYTDEDLAPQIPPQHRSKCAQTQWYASPSIQARLRAADAIWLASSWLPWVAERLPASVARLQAEFTPRVLVFGTKHFGRINLRRFIDASSGGDPQGLRGTPLAERVEVNKQMKADLDSAVFVDAFDLLCGPDYACPVTDDEGHLLSFDGVHLTAEGARVLGAALKKAPQLAPYLGAEGAPNGK